jgi:hypothetical protein
MVLVKTLVDGVRWYDIVNNINDQTVIKWSCNGCAREYFSHPKIPKSRNRPGANQPTQNHPGSGAVG